MNNLIQVLPCVDPDQCDRVLEGIDHSHFQSSRLFGDGNVFFVEDNMRSSASIALQNDSQEANIIHECMNQALVLYRQRLMALNNIFAAFPIPGGYNVRSFREPIQIIRYKAGQKYNFHHDTPDENWKKEYGRTISIIVYLTDKFEGGGTEFVGATFKPNKGEALVFPAGWTHPHKGQEVTSGEKIIAVSWYYSELIV
jgi:prolyl 4-hydroxylase